MNLSVDFTENDQFSLSELESMQQINEITFIVPIFIFFQNNFKLIYNYAAFLASRPLIKTNIKPIATEDEMKQLQQNDIVLVRGTFDHLHLGHQVLLMKAIYSTSHKLIIQIKNDEILKNKKLKQLIQPLQVRKQNVRKFVQDLKPQIEIKISVINQVYGSAPYTKGIDAVVITQQSIHSLNHINKLRKSNNGLKKVQMIISPLITSYNQSLLEDSARTKQQRIDHKLSSFKIRQHIIKSNNFTLAEYLDYKSIWDSLIKEINSLCRIKESDLIVMEKWWERVVYKHSKKCSGLNYTKKARKNNRQIYLEMSKHNNASTPNQHSLTQISTNLALLLEGIQEEEKNLQAVGRNFLQALLKKKGKTKTCKKIRKMILSQMKQFMQKSRKSQNQKSSAPVTQKSSTAAPEESNIMNVTLEDIRPNITSLNRSINNIEIIKVKQSTKNDSMQL